MTEEPEQMLEQYRIATARRIASCYGSLAASWLPAELTVSFGHELCVEEVDYLIEQEWACTAEDILWRRGKMGLWFSPEQVENLDNYIARYFS